MDVLIIYQFCTFGGVERVVLNRAKAFKKFNLDVHLSVGYLHDSGALKSFQNYISAHGLQKELSAFLISKNKFPDLETYDYIFLIDTPQAFNQVINAENVYVECHTSYLENRQYLRHIPENIKGILVPSGSFRSLIREEFPDLPPIQVMPNPIPDDFFDVKQDTKKFYKKSPLTYYGRLDSWKNYDEAFQIFSYFADDSETMFLIVGYGADDIKILQTLEKDGLLAKSLLRSGIDFDRATYLINLVRTHQGVFVSPSKGESFGLSAAEFMCGGVPVLLSKVPAHEELVDHDERFLYTLGDILEAKQKINFLQQNWIAMRAQIVNYTEKFKAHTFIEAWDNFLTWNENN